MVPGDKTGGGKRGVGGRVILWFGDVEELLKWAFAEGVMFSFDASSGNYVRPERHGT